MENLRDSVIVAHSGTQHSQYLAVGLQKAGLLRLYYTRVFWDPRRRPFNVLWLLGVGRSPRLYVVLHAVVILSWIRGWRDLVSSSSDEGFARDQTGDRFATCREDLSWNAAGIEGFHDWNTDVVF